MKSFRPVLFPYKSWEVLKHTSSDCSSDQKPFRTPFRTPLSSGWFYLCLCWFNIDWIGFVYWLCSGLVDCIWRLFLFCNFATLPHPVQQRHPKLSQVHPSFKLQHSALCTMLLCQITFLCLLSSTQNEQISSAGRPTVSGTQLNSKHFSLIRLQHTVNTEMQLCTTTNNM